MSTLKTSILGIEFENPFLLASAPPTASIESIDKAFEMGVGFSKNENKGNRVKSCFVFNSQANLLN